MPIVNINLPNAVNVAPIHIACINNNVESVRMLHDNNADMHSVWSLPLKYWPLLPIAYFVQLLVGTSPLPYGTVAKPFDMALAEQAIKVINYYVEHKLVDVKSYKQELDSICNNWEQSKELVKDDFQLLCSAYEEL